MTTITLDDAEINAANILIPDYEFDGGEETDVIFISKSAYLKDKKKNSKDKPTHVKQ
jgi:hypothetical protein